MTLRENMGGPPLSAAALTAALVRPGGLWRRIEVVADTGSTNADLLALAAAGFRAAGGGGEPGTPVRFRRELAGQLPQVPSWLRAPADVAGELRGLLAAVTGRPELEGVGAGAPLFGPPVSLDSLAGTLLLREIQLRYQVDVAAEDLNLDSLATLATLAAFVSEHAR